MLSLSATQTAKCYIHSSPATPLHVLPGASISPFSSHRAAASGDAAAAGRATTASRGARPASTPPGGRAAPAAAPLPPLS